MVPDHAIVRQLRAVDPNLSVVWCPDVERFGIFHSLQVPGNVEASVDATAHELMYQLALSGYVTSLEDCGRIAREKARTWQLVCYCVNDDGSFRPLDTRIVTKLQRMKWLCEEVGLMGIRQMLQARADAVERQKARDADTIWDDIRRDKVAAHCISNALWGVKHPLHHQVQGLSKTVGEPPDEPTVRAATYSLSAGRRISGEKAGMEPRLEDSAPGPGANARGEASACLVPSKRCQ